MVPVTLSRVNMQGSAEQPFLPFFPRGGRCRGAPRCARHRLLGTVLSVVEQGGAGRVVRARLSSSQVALSDRCRRGAEDGLCGAAAVEAGSEA